MENEPELIRDQMQETRTALTEKLEALESQVSNTVQGATAAVTDTVQTVKDTVEETVSTVKESVKDAFDLAGHVERHPWLAMLGSVAAGYLAGRMLEGLAGGPRRDVPRQYDAFADSLRPPPRETNGAAQEKEEAPRHEEEEGWLGGLAKAYGAELDALKGLGLAAVAGVVRDLATQSVGGEIGSRLRRWMDDVTEKMGAKPLSEPVLQQDEPAPAKAEPKRGGQTSVRRETIPRM